MKFSSQMSGFDELGKVLRTLPERMEKNVYQSAVLKGANEMKKAFRDATPSGPGKHDAGHGRDNFKVKKIRADKTGASYVLHSGKAFWLYFREYGRGVVATKVKKSGKAGVLSDGNTVFGKSVKAQPARPTIRPAFDNNWERVFKVIGLALSTGLLREAKKLSGEYKTAAKALGVRRR